MILINYIIGNEGVVFLKIFFL